MELDIPRLSAEAPTDDVVAALRDYLSTPPEIARTLPRRTQELLGYAAHDAIASGGGYLGAVDLLDPVHLMARGKL